MSIILYSTGCPKCKVLKSKLEEKNIEFVENNSVEEMTGLGITQVPVLFVGGVLLLLIHVPASCAADSDTIVLKTVVVE